MRANFKNAIYRFAIDDKDLSQLSIDDLREITTAYLKDYPESFVDVIVDLCDSDSWKDCLIKLMGLEESHTLFSNFTAEKLTKICKKYFEDEYYEYCSTLRYTQSMQYPRYYFGHP